MGEYLHQRMAHQFAGAVVVLGRGAVQGVKAILWAECKVAQIHEFTVAIAPPAGLDIRPVAMAARTGRGDAKPHAAISSVTGRYFASQNSFFAGTPIHIQRQRIAAFSPLFHRQGYRTSRRNRHFHIDPIAVNLHRRRHRDGSGIGPGHEQCAALHLRRNGHIYV